jgi:AraC-like DNA-binding protein
MNIRNLVLLSGQGSIPSRASIEARFPNFFAVQFLEEGSLCFQRGGGEVINFEVPTFFWTNPTDHYRYHPGVTGSWIHNWVSFSGPQAQMFYQPLLEDLAPGGYLPIRTVREMRDVFQELLRVIDEEVPGCPEGIYGLNRLLQILRENRTGSPEPRDGLSRIKELLEQAPEKEYDFGRLARSHGYSYSNFRRLFKTRYSRSPHAFLMIQRMQKAARLLTHTPDSVVSIGEAVGVPDPASFSRMFKDHYGLSPRSFRQAGPGR